LITSLMIIGVCAEVFIKQSHETHFAINIIFCSAIILYIISLYMLHYVAIRNFPFRKFFYVGGIILIIILLFLNPLPPLIVMLSSVILFLILFGLQFLT